jgi:hypothetical protein
LGVPLVPRVGLSLQVLGSPPLRFGSPVGFSLQSLTQANNFSVNELIETSKQAQQLRLFIMRQSI